MNKRNISAILLAFSLFLVAAGCKKEPPAPPPPPPPPPKAETPPAKPVVSTFVAEPSSIERGQSSTLRWSVDNATEVSISEGIGAVQSSGNRRVFPSNTTNYTLTAKGPGGTVTRSARVTVTQPPPPPPPKREPPKVTIEQRLQNEVSDAYFDLDQYDIRDAPDNPVCGTQECRSNAQAVMSQNASALKSILSDFPGSVVTVEGHCDERGSAEYNLGLGDRRATAAKEYLVNLGVSDSRLRTISYGKERPQCTQSDEACWQRNRRVHFSTQ